MQQNEKKMKPTVFKLKIDVKPKKPTKSTYYLKLLPSSKLSRSKNIRQIYPLFTLIKKSFCSHRGIKGSSLTRISPKLSKRTNKALPCLFFPLVVTSIAKIRCILTHGSCRWQLLKLSTHKENYFTVKFSPSYGMDTQWPAWIGGIG